MYEFKCKNCGKQLAVRLQEEIHAFCCKECRSYFLRTKNNHVAPIERSANPDRDIHSNGIDNLIVAIVSRATADVLHNKPESFLRQDAERFFLSDYFSALTDMDGKEILHKLHYIYNERRKKRRAQV